MIEYLNRLFGRRHSSATAKERLRLVLMSDHLSLAPEMVEAMKGRFEKIYSIELNDELYGKAKERFVSDKNVTLLHGDSGEVLPMLLSNITEPVLFWLDGHYSAGITSKGNLNTPIVKELRAICEDSTKHVILIDDARLFVGKEDYPTYDEIAALGGKYGYTAHQKDDSIVLHA